MEHRHVLACALHRRVDNRKREDEQSVSTFKITGLFIVLSLLSVSFATAGVVEDCEQLVEKGITREEAYKIVQENAHTAWNKPEGNFRDLISKDPRVTAKLSSAEIAACFDPQHHLQHLDQVYQRLGI